MLTIYPIMLGIDDINIDKNTVFDVDSTFISTEIKDIEHASNMIRLIDKGQFNGGSSFIDRFGNKLLISELSTGCKAAILVNELRDKKILCFECGDDAIGAIVRNCQIGNIIIYDPLSGIYAKSYDKPNIDVVVDKYRFTDLDRLNYYFRDERPDKPDMTYGGIEYA